MSNIRDILTLRDVVVEDQGVSFALRRPSALDLIEALEYHKTNPAHMQAWFVLRHLVDLGQPVFSSIDEVLACDALVVQRIATHCEALYGEGRD